MSGKAVDSMFAFGPTIILELEHGLLYAAGLLSTIDDRIFSLVALDYAIPISVKEF